MKEQKEQILFWIMAAIIAILVIVNVISIAKLDLFGGKNRKAKTLINLSKEKIEKINTIYLSPDYIYYYPSSCLDDKTFDKAYVAFTYDGSYKYYFAAKSGNDFYGPSSEETINKMKKSETDTIFNLPNDTNKAQLIIDAKTCDMLHPYDGFFVPSSEKCFTADKDGIIRHFSDDKACHTKVISVPAKVDGKKIVRIDINAMHNLDIDVLDFSNAKHLVRIKRNGNFESSLDNKIKHVNIRSLNYLEHIEEYAFTMQSLTSVSMIDLPRLMSVQSEAFSNNQLTDLYMDNLPMMKSLYSPFHHNKLKKVDLRGLKNLEEIAYDAFSHNEILDVDFSANDKLWRIGHKAFINNQITALDFSKNTSLRNIELEAFAQNKISTINFGAIDLVIIGNGAFKQNKITSIDLTKNNKLNRILQNAFKENPIKTISIGDNTSVGCIASSSVDDPSILEASKIPIYNIQPLC